ncbi:formylglycine-generating enzyme required for sulfatase activity [Idiomarina aquatica]|uniref:Formylglycine-generating enzyme required for sulfatase activity n=1 Tax=Idiomarina aquatica TaxID=1327752 RepID=A0A4R6P5D1_9GAMM|nr:formylglycine-generating enzyme family protein [Idiomarina aquatica]TDP32741.1 formylglycine-generating enzyme required for sulfatase activity [Idiomarina aquatica]
MMRLARLAVIMASTLTFASTALAQQESDATQMSVEEISNQIATLQTEYDNFSDTVATLQREEQQLREQLQSLRERNRELEQQRQVALEEMNNRYQQLVDDPSIDIAGAQEAYKEAVMAHQQNKEDIKTQVQLVSAKSREVEEARVSKHSLLNEIETFKDQRNVARVERLQEEFNRTGDLEVSQSIVCDREETLSQCETRGKLLAKQKASKQYLDQTLADLSESELARTNLERVSPNVQILGSKTVSDGFSGQGNYGVKMGVELRGQLPQSQACTLLDIDVRYCAVKRTASNEPATDEPVDSSVMHPLTIRSNVYDDEVMIDGVSYGSTPIEVMLPGGEHEVEIIKYGYTAFNQTLNLKDAQVIRAELEKSEYSFTRGEKIQDILFRDVRGPELVVMPSGNFKMGDLTGNGMANERPATTESIARPFGITDTEITVTDFRKFVNDTAYVTEAEKNGSCAVLQNGMPKFNDSLNWRNPGFSQSETSPVVCVSLNDAQAYTQWLTQKSGFDYNLPTEAQWEYAARAGTETDFWWGNDVGFGKANCRNCGSDWSNQRTAPVGSFQRNPWGLFDTVGNVWEWTTSEQSSVVRGGAWNFAPSLARVSTRMELPADFSSNYIGFRVVRAQ